MYLWVIVVVVVGMVLLKIVLSHNISIQNARKKIDEGAMLVDVRSIEEFESGHIKDACNIPHDCISDISKYVDDENKPILLYCLSGMRAAVACSELKKNGYSDVHNVGSFARAKKII